MPEADPVDDLTILNLSGAHGSAEMAAFRQAIVVALAKFGETGRITVANYVDGSDEIAALTHKLAAAQAKIAALEAELEQRPDVPPPPPDVPPPPTRPALPLKAIAISPVSVRYVAGELLRINATGTEYTVRDIRDYTWNLGDNRAVVNESGGANVWAERLVWPALAIPWPLRLVDPMNRGRRINQAFGMNPQAYARFGLPGHNGLDLAAGVGDPVRACADGIVYNVEQADGNAYGVHVQLAHSVRGGDEWNLFLTTYAHLSEAKVKAGDVVLGGEALGLAGSTGNSTGPHLHLGLDWIGHGAAGYGQAVNPLPYIDFQ